MNKEAEKKRLAKEVFEGAYLWVKWSSMNLKGEWCWHENKPSEKILNTRWCSSSGRCRYSKNQPETELPWQETLLERKDYE